MLRKEMSKGEIERELQGKGDYVLIDNITRFLKENLPMDIKRFLYTKLIGIYEKRNMFSEAAELYSRLSEISLTSSEKSNCYIKETEDYIKAGFSDRADLAMRKATGGEMKEIDRRKVMNSIISFYKTQAGLYEKERRRNHAVKIYEKLLSMNISEAEKNEINRKLIPLYRELGMIEQYMAMSKKMG